VWSPIRLQAPSSPLRTPAGELAVVEHIVVFVVLIQYVDLYVISVFFDDPLVKGLLKF
jgi:hypothetical protein